MVKALGCCRRSAVAGACPNPPQEIELNRILPSLCFGALTQAFLPHPRSYAGGHDRRTDRGMGQGQRGPAWSGGVALDGAANGDIRKDSSARWSVSH
jgi:hypothetical protein